MVWITLNEAVTRLMGVEPRGPAAEVLRFHEAQARMLEHGKACHRELSGSADGRRWLRNLLQNEFVGGRERRIPVLSCWPPGRILATMGERDPAWHPVLLALFDATKEVQRGMDLYDAALQKILDAGQDPRIRFTGRISRRRGSRREPIPSDHFVNHLTLDGERRHLIPKGLLGAGPGFHALPRAGVAEPDEIPVYYDVEVDETGVSVLWRPQGGEPVLSTPRGLSAPAEEELEAFGDDLKASLPEPPARDALVKLGAERFGKFKGFRDVFRAKRKQWWPEATKPGPRRKRR